VWGLAAAPARASGGRPGSWGVRRCQESMHRPRVKDTGACQGGCVAGVGHTGREEGRGVGRPSWEGVARDIAGGDGAPLSVYDGPYQRDGWGDRGWDGAATYYRQPPYPLPPSPYHRAPSPYPHSPPHVKTLTRWSCHRRCRRGPRRRRRRRPRVRGASRRRRAGRRPGRIASEVLGRGESGDATAAGPTAF